MNRSIALVGVGVILAGLALVAFPIVVLGGEQFDLEQMAGLLVAPVGLVVVLIGAVQHDPERTTVGGTFGNPDEARSRTPGRGGEFTRSLTYSPRESVNCRFCWSVITYDQATCPRCARARDCRSCGRPLGLVLERATCPTCARAEAFCNCPRLNRSPPSGTVRRIRRG